MRDICELKMFRKHRDLLTKIKEERVFSIYNCGNKFYISEECDNYFSHELTAKDCKELSRVFDELADIFDEYCNR